MSNDSYPISKTVDTTFRASFSFNVDDNSKKEIHLTKFNDIYRITNVGLESPDTKSDDIFGGMFSAKNEVRISESIMKKFAEIVLAIEEQSQKEIK